MGNMEDGEKLHEIFHIRSWDVSRIDTWTNLEFYVRISFVFSLFWLKLTYHLWYFEEYFYFNRVMLNVETFLSSSSLTDLDVNIQIQTPNAVKRNLADMAINIRIQTPSTVRHYALSE